MRSFIASEFSKGLVRLLISSPIILFATPNQNFTEDVMLPNRSQISPKDKWNVEALYSDPTSWMSDFTSIKGSDQGARWPELASFRGKLNDPKVLAEFLNQYLAMNRKLEKLSVYAHLRFDEDQDNDQFKTNDGLIKGIYQDFSFERTAPHFKS
jgi:oligoendopeptidase F